ncbi:MAG: CCC motif membrane protein, partial [Bacteroidota bacterium]|nr:CCC motif membrane protein [Bacteroidota bacterium]
LDNTRHESKGYILVPAYLMANKKIKDAELNPEDYEGSVSAMNTAKIVALVVLAINLLNLIYTIYVFATGDFSEFQKEWEKAMQEFNQSALLI